MTANINILLIDKRISHYEAIIAAVDPALSKGITFDYYTDTFDTLKERMVSGSSGVLANSVGLVQHNYKMPTFKMVDAQTTSSTIEQVEIQDSELSTWAPLKEFIEWCKTELSTAHFDMMACALYSNPDWKYVIDTLSTQTGVEIRASTDDTGSSSLGGNWVLESHVGINLKEVYFNDSIENYTYLLDYTMFNNYPENANLYTTQIPTITTLPSRPTCPTNPTLPLSAPTLPPRPSLSGYTTSYGVYNELQGNGGSVVSYGDDNNSNCSFSKVSTQLQSGVAYLFSNGAALKTNGNLVLWGDNMAAGKTIMPTTSNLSSGVCSIARSSGLICALKSDGSVVLWGNFSSGFPAFPSSDLSSGVNFVAATSNDIACLKSDGSIRGWGAHIFNTSSSVPAAIYPSGSNLNGGFVKLVSRESPPVCAAIKTDGSVVFFGATTATNHFSNPTTFYPSGSNISSGVVDVFIMFNYFLALKSDGSLVAWGAGAGTANVNGKITGKTAVKVVQTRSRATLILSDGTYVALEAEPTGSAGTYTNIVDVIESIQYERYLFLKSDGTLAWKGPSTGFFYYYSVGIEVFTNVVKMWNDSNGQFNQGAIVLTSTGELRNLVNNTLMATDVNDAIVSLNYVTYVTSSGKVRVIKKPVVGSRQESVVNNAPYPAIRANGAGQESATSLLATLNDDSVCTVLKTAITYPHLFVFNGTTYATCPYNQYNTALDLVTGYAGTSSSVGGNAFTIETWYYQPSQTVNSTIVDRGDYCYLFQVSTNSNQPAYSANAGVLSFYNKSSGWMHATSAVVATSGWTHIAMTREGTSYKFYINGVLKQTMTGLATLYRDDGVLGIGTQLGGTTTGGNYTNLGCSMYDLRLWNVRRTDDQIKSYMNVSVDPSSFGLVANYLFNDNENIFRDRTRNGFHCTIGNYVSTSWKTYHRNSKPDGLLPSSIGVFLNPDYTLVRQSYFILSFGTEPLRNLVKTDFTGANLTGINFTGRDLTGVNLSGANLTNVNFSNAILTGITVNKSTNFTGASFANAVIYSVIGTVNPSLVPTNYLHYFSNVNLTNVLVDYNNVNTSIALPPTSITNYAVHFADYYNFKKSNARFYISWATDSNALSFSSSSYTPKVRFQIIHRDTNVVGVDVLFDYADGKGCIETNVPFYIDIENEGNGSVSDTSPVSKNISLRFRLWGELVNGVKSSSYAEIITGTLPFTPFSLFSNILTTAPSWYTSITTNSNNSRYANYIGYLNHSDNKLFLYGKQTFASGVISPAGAATFYDWATNTPYIVPATSGSWRSYTIDPTGNSAFINVWASTSQGWCRYVFSTNTLTVLSTTESCNNTVFNSTGTRAYTNDINNLLVYNLTTNTASVVSLGVGNLRNMYIDKNDKYVVTSSYDAAAVYIINIVNDANTKISTGQIVSNDTLSWAFFDDSSTYCYAAFNRYRGDIYRIKLSDGTWILFKALPAISYATIINKYLYIFGINSSNNQYSMIDTTDATRTVIVNSFPTGYDAVLQVYETKNNNVYCSVNYNGVPTIAHFTGFPNTFSNSSGIMLGPSMNYSNANLANYNLSNKNFTSSKFTNATITNVDFTNSNLTTASFSGAVDYSTADLTGATLTGATFSDSLFDYTLDANNNATVVKYRGSASLVFPEKVSGTYTITAIGDNMDWGLNFTNFSFSATSQLVSIGASGGPQNMGIITSPFGPKNFFPPTLTRIGYQAFYYRNVASSPEFPTSNDFRFAAIILPPGVNFIGQNAFSQFSVLVKIKPTLAWSSSSALTTSRETGSTFTYTATSSGPVGYTGYNGSSANSNMPVYYASTNTSIATIHSLTGLVTLVGVGTVTFTANQDSQNTGEVGFYSADTITSATLTVTKGTPPPLSNVTVSKTYGTTVGPITIPTLAVTGFPVLNSLTNWIIDIGFTTTGGANSWRALLGSMYNAVDSRGWGIWVSNSNKILYSHKNLTYEFTNGSVSINVAYNLNITKVGTSITFNLTNVSTQVSSTYTATNVTDPMGLGPVSIGGWVSGIETFPGTINYVVVKDHISIGNKVFQVTAPAGSSVSGGIMRYAFLSGDTTVASISDSGLITVNKAGTVVFSASQDETSSYFAPTPVTATLTVSKATPILSNVTVSKMFGDAAFQVTAPEGSSVSGGTMHYIFSSGDTTVASITDAGLITVNKAGTVVFSASQDFTTNYNSPLPVSVTLTVAKATPTLSGFTIPPKTYTYGTDTAFQVTATTSSGSNGTFRYSSNNSAVASINASGAVGTVTINGAGSATFTVNQDSTDNYNAPAPLTAILTVIKGTPTIAISNLSKSTIDPTFTFASSTASDGARTFSSNTPGVATIHPSSGLVTIVGIVGTTTITVSQAASTNYNAPSNATATLTVIKGTPILSAFSIAPKIFGDSPFAVTAPASQNTVVGTFHYTSDTLGVATIDSGTITIVGAGSTTITATQDATTNFNAPTPITAILTVAKATPTIVVSNITKSSIDPTFTFARSTASNGALTFSSSSDIVAKINSVSGVVTVVSAGTATITVSQVATTNYNAPTNATATLTVTAGTLTNAVIPSGADLSGKNLSGASLVGATLANVVLSNSNLNGANFSGANVAGTDFTNASIVGATNLPTFSTKQKLELLYNANNAGANISQLQFSAPLSVSELNAALSVPIPELSSVNTEFLVAAPVYDVSNVKTVTIAQSSISSVNNTSFYIPLNKGETVKINGASFTLNASNQLLDNNGVVLKLIVVNGYPFKIYSGSIIAVNISSRMNNVTFDDEGQIKLYDVVNSMVTAALAQEALSGLVAGYVSELYSYLNLSYVDVYNRNNPVLDATVTSPVFSSYASNTNTFSYSVIITGPAENPLSLDKTKYKFIVESVNTATNSRTTVSQPTWDSVASPTTIVCASLLPLTSYSVIVTPTLFNSTSNVNLKSLLPVKTFTLTTPLDYGLISSITFTKEGTSWYFNFQYSGYASLTSFTMGLRWIQFGGYGGSITQNFSSVPISNGTNKYLITDTQNYLNVGGPSLIANVVTATIDYVSGTATKQNITTFVPNPIGGGPHVVVISNFNTEVYPGTCSATIPASLHNQIGGGKSYVLRFVEKDTGIITNMSSFDSASSSSSVTIPISLYGKTFTCELLIQNLGYSYTGEYVILPYTPNANYFTVPNPTGLFPTVTTELQHTGMIWSLGGATDDVRLFKVSWLTATAGLNVSSPNYTSKVRVNIKLSGDSSYRFTGVYNYADGFGYSIFHSSIRTSQGQNGGTWVVDIRSENSDGTITTNYSTFSQYAGSGPASGFYTSLSNMAAAAGTSTVLYGVGVI